jgi:HEAT repeat protein
VVRHDADVAAEVTSRREVAAAGHLGDVAVARAGLLSDEAAVRATAIGALERAGGLTDADVAAGLGDASPVVRRRAAEAAAGCPHVSLLAALRDPDWSVVEMACWSAGERTGADDAVIARLIELAGGHGEPLVREAAVAALGALGDPRGLAAIVAATHDKPAIRRRAAVALAPFEEPEADEALRVLLTDRDWQTRQIAEDLLGVDRT